MTAEPVDALDWRTTLDALLEHPATWRHIAVQAELASRRHPDGYATHSVLRRLAWAAADLAYYTAGTLPPVEVLTTEPEEPTEWDRHQFTEMEARAANSEYNRYLRGRRGPLTPRESAARRQYKRDNYRPVRRLEPAEDA